MTRPPPARIVRWLGPVLIVAASPVGIARGDGGTLRAWQQHGRGEIAVFTQPSPFVAGPVDISVLLLDQTTGEPIRDARVVVEIAPVAQPDQRTRHLASQQAATNKLMHAAVFELSDATPCNVTVEVAWPDDHARIQFSIDVGRSWSPKTGIWPWVLWPLLVVLGYALHLHRSARRPRSRTVPR